MVLRDLFVEFSCGKNRQTNRIEHMSMNVMLTGASGVLGTRILETLANKDDIRIYALTSKPDALAYGLSDEALPSALDRTVVIDRDLALEDKELFDKVEVVIHAGFPRKSDGASIYEGLKYTYKICRVTREKNIRFINISSQSVYSLKRERPADELVEPCPEKPLWTREVVIRTFGLHVIRKRTIHQHPACESAGHSSEGAFC